MDDLISRRDAINALGEEPEVWFDDDNGDYDRGMRAQWRIDVDALKAVLSAEPEEVIPHRNYKYLSDFWCECGWHLGKKGDVKYCAECGRKVKWDG